MTAETTTCYERRKSAALGKGGGRSLETSHQVGIDPKENPREFRNALGRFASGVTVLTTEHEGETYGMTANAFVSVSLDPPLVLVSIGNRTKWRDKVEASRRYGVSVISREQATLSNHFAGKKQDGLAVPFVRKHGMPLIEGALAHFVCGLYDVHPAGDHTLYVGRVERTCYHDGAPLLFYTGNYRWLEVPVWEDSYICW
jgi:flavin reductase (DIM6/NTAB) family NADH-FMN oxidoreductase RutF